jgi:hypothetical protein
MNEKSLNNKEKTTFRRAKEKKSTENHERGTGQLKSKAIKKGD